MMRIFWLLSMLAVALIPGTCAAQAVQTADFDGDGAVGFGDFVRFAGAFGSADGTYDLDGDGAVGAGDFTAFARAFGGRAQEALYKAPGKQGVADLTLRQRETGSSTPAVRVGDVLEAEVFVKANGAEITQVDVLLSFDDTYLEVIPSAVQGGLIRPFESGGFLSGTLVVNDTQGDTIGGNRANQIPLFQMRYSEIIPKFQGVPQRAAVGNGVVARFRLRVLRRPVDGVARVRVDLTWPTGAETGYFIDGDPGSIYNFAALAPMAVTVARAPDVPLTRRQAVVVATVTRNGAPAAGLAVAFSRSISGRTVEFRWQGTTGPDGRARVAIAADEPQFWRVGASGYYLARAVNPSTGVVVGEWGSIPVRGGQTQAVTLPVGGLARPVR